LKLFGNDEKNLKQGRVHMHYDTIWNWYEKNSTCFDLIKVKVRKVNLPLEMWK